MANKNLPPSFRFAFASQLAKLPPEQQQVHKATFDALTDLYAANSALAAKVGAPATTTPLAASTTIATTTETVINQPGNVTGGMVNLQTGVTAYNLQQSDNASLVVLNDASPIAVTLNTTLTVPFYVTISNQGAGAATLTPTIGLVNGVASLSVPGGSFVTLFLDGTDWWADIPGTSTGAVT